MVGFFIKRLNFFRYYILQNASYSKKTVISNGVKIKNFNKSRGTLILNDCKVNRGCFLSVNENGKLKISSNSTIGERSRITCDNYIEIGDNVLLGPNVFISDMSHEYKDVNIPICYQDICKSKRKVIIGNDSWIGANVCILPGSVIGKHCVIGCNSVVNSTIPDYSVAVGAPAKVVKFYDFKQQKWISVRDMK